MKTRQWILIVLLGMLAMACSDQTKDTHTITGSIFFNGTMEPMDGIFLSLYQSNGQEGLQTDILGSNRVTAADGGYTFEIQPFKNGEAGKITIGANASTTINLAFNQQSLSFPILFVEIDPALVIEDDIYMLDIIGEQFGFLEVEFKGNTDFLFGDEVELKVIGDGYAHQTPLQVGDNLDQKYRYPVKAGVWTSVEWTARISGLETVGKDSVFCRNRVTTSFRIDL